MNITDLFAFMAGCSCKLYDDIQDIPHYKNYKNNIYLTEALKGIHYILFTIVSLKDNFFFITQYIINSLHTLTSKESFSNPYEHTLFYSFFILFFALDYKKLFQDIQYYFQNLSNNGMLNFNNPFILYTYLLTFIITAGTIEPIIYSEENSFKKLFIRLLATIFFFIIYFINKTENSLYFILYSAGYMLCSTISQIYILYIKDVEKDVEKDFEKDEKDVEKDVEKDENVEKDEK
jgi:hypothetical protein